MTNEAVARIARAFPDINAARLVGKVQRGEVDAGTTLIKAALDSSSSRPTVPNLPEAARRAQPFSGTPRRLTSDPPARRLKGKTPGARARARSRTVDRESVKT